MLLKKLKSTSAEIASLAETTLSYSEAAKYIMHLLRGLVPSDTINLGTIDLGTEGGFHFALDGFLMPPERRELLSDFMHEHPMVEYARRNGVNPPLRFTDFHTRRQLVEVPMYRECYRGYVHSMMTFGIAAPPGLNVSFALSRADCDFTDKERDSLGILQPLVSAVMQQRILREALSAAYARGVPVGIVHGAAEFVHTLDDHALALLQAHFPNRPRHRLPEVAWRVLRREPNRVVTLAGLPGGGRLCARLSPDVRSWRMEVWEERSAVPPAKLTAAGLTGRQVEVVQWLAKGKSTAEIAMILSISPRTVQKHLEIIYRQLGVENRLAAINFCRQWR
ncbi:MAG: hypothetical protein JJU00_07190 [Opitutales bacterium]|nr:hypothetical protein [Opitutales bacterium]